MGMGKALVEHAERALADLGCVKINLQVIDGNDGAEEFYHRCGYATEKRISMGKKLPLNFKAQ